MKLKFCVKNFTLLVITICIKLSPSSCLGEKMRIKMFSEALKVIVRDFYAKNSMEFDIIAADMKAWKFASELIQNIAKPQQFQPVTISFVDWSKFYHINLTRSSVIFVESSAFYSRNINKIQMRNVDYVRVRHFVIYLMVEILEMAGPIRSSAYKTNALYYYENEKVIDLLQTTTQCGPNNEQQAAIVMVNNFF